MSMLIFASTALMAPLGDKDGLFQCIGGKSVLIDDWKQVPTEFDKTLNFRVAGLKDMFDSAVVDNEITPPSEDFVLEGDWFDPEGVKIFRVNSEYDQVSIHGQEYSLYLNEAVASGWIVGAAFNRVTDSDDQIFVCRVTLGWDADITDYGQTGAE